MADRTETFYPATGALTGYGCQLLVGDNASPETFEAVAGIRTITPGEMSTEVGDRTHLRSPDAHKEKMAGMRDSGPFAGTGVWLPREESQSNAGGGTGSFTAGGLVKLWRTREERNFIIRLFDGSPATEWPFRGIVTRFQPGELGGGPDAVDFTFEITPLQAFDADLP